MYNIEHNDHEFKILVFSNKPKRCHILTNKFNRTNKDKSNVVSKFKYSLIASHKCDHEKNIPIKFTINNCTKTNQIQMVEKPYLLISPEI